MVVCAGPWARRLLAPHGIDLPVVETRETVAYFRLEGARPVGRRRGRDEGARLLLARRPGPRAEGRQPHARQAGRPGRRRGRRPGARRGDRRVDGERFPAADPEPVDAQSCFYTTTDDERFILERHGRIVVGSACSGHGFKFAPAVGKRLAALALELALRLMPMYQRLGDVPRKRHIQFRDNGTLLTEEVMGLEGFSGNESILYHLHSPCRVIRSSAGSSRSSATSGCPTRTRTGTSAPTTTTPEGGDPITGPPPADVERRRRDLALPPDRGDGLLLPERRGRRGDLRPRGLGHARDDLRRPAVQGGRLRRRPARHDLPLRAGGRPQRHLVFESPGPDRDPAPLPQRVRPAARARAVLPPRHPPADRAAHAPRARRVPASRCASAAATRPTSSTTTRSTSSAGTATSTRGRSRSTTSSRSPAGSTCRRRRTRPSRARTS